MRIMNFLSDKHARSDSGRIALALVVVLGIIVVGSMTGWFGLQRGIPAAAPSFASLPAAPAGLPVSDQTGKPITSYTARIVDGRSGSFLANTNGVLIYRETDDPSDPTVTAFRAINPNTGTDIQIAAGERIKAVYQQGTTYYSASRFGESNRRATAGSISVPSGVTAAALSVVDTGWPLVYAVSTLIDPLEEDSPSGQQQFVTNTNATVAPTDHWRTGVSTNCFAVGGGAAGAAAPADGDTIFFNRTQCTTWRLRFDYNTGNTASSKIREPCVIIEDPNYNRTGVEITSATLTVVSGSGVAPRSTDVTAAMNQNRPILLYPEDSPWVDNGRTTTLELGVTTSTEWTAGESFRFVFEDQCGAEGGRAGWSVLSNNTGSAVQTMVIERARGLSN